MAKQPTILSPKRTSSSDQVNRLVSPRLFHALPYLVIVSLCLLLYGRTATFGFTALDDDALILGNYRFISNIANVGYAFLTDAAMTEGGAPFYRPLQTASFMVDAQVGAKQPFVYHVSNIVIHAMTCCALLYLLCLLGYRRALAAAATLVFAAHPLFAQAVSWIPARGDLLLGLFGILSVIALVLFAKRCNWLFLGLNAAAFALAMLSKENAVVLPLIYACYLFSGEGKSVSPMQRMVSAGVWVLLAALFVIDRSMVMGSLARGNEFGLSVLATSLPVIPELLSRFFLPVGLAVMPGFDTATTILGLVVLCALVILTLVSRGRRWGLVLVGAVWFLSLSIPGMMYRHSLGANAYDYLYHRSYLPMAGVLIVLIELFPAAYVKRRAGYAATVLIIALLSAASYAFSSDFANQRIFYDKAVAGNPRSALALNNRANLRELAGDHQGAIGDCNRALQLRLDYADAYNTRAISETSLGDFAGATADLTVVIREKPTWFVAYANRGKCRFMMKDLPGALEDFDEAVQLNPTRARGYSNRGGTRFAMGDNKGALEDFETAIRLEPDMAEAYNNRGLVEVKQGQVDAAMADFQKARALLPTYADPWLNIGLTKFNRGDRDGACSYWDRAASLGNRGALKMLQDNCGR
jgi:protein O-mannosyl-transferase